MWIFTAGDICDANCIWGKIQRVQKAKNTMSFPLMLLDIDLSLLNMSAFTWSWNRTGQQSWQRLMGVYVQKPLGWSQICHPQIAILIQEHQWSNIENLSKPKKLVFEHSLIHIWTWRSMHLEYCPNDWSTYLSKFSQTNVALLTVKVENP